jgi:septal ring factor EnvC (AmiA/AmiB activator)
VIGKIRAALAGLGALTFAVMALVLRRRTKQLAIAKLEVTHCEDDLANQKTKDEISTLEGKIEADEKDRHEKDDRLDHMLDAIERRRAGPR